jgi:hypothetical protein
MGIKVQSLIWHIIQAIKRHFPDVKWKLIAWKVNRVIPIQICDLKQKIQIGYYLSHVWYIYANQLLVGHSNMGNTISSWVFLHNNISRRIKVRWHTVLSGHLVSLGLIDLINQYSVLFYSSILFRLLFFRDIYFVILR